MISRGSGILLHISSLPSSWGIGDLGPQAYRFADFLVRTEQSYWQILPLNPVNTGSGYSPYFSTCVFAGNPLLISIDMLLEQKLINHDDITPIPAFTEGNVDYGTVVPYKMGVLKKAYHRFCTENGHIQEQFIQFCQQHAWWLDDYTLFMILKEHFKGNEWNQWPDEFKNRNAEALKTVAAQYADTIQEKKFYQFLFFQQWRNLKKYCNEQGIRIIGDMPIYVSLDSTDVWTNTALFKLDEYKKPTAVSGVPPDYFSATGQLWNTPVYNWSALKDTNYLWWSLRMKRMFEEYDIVRIDHFRGLVQYWEIPAHEKTAINGAWMDVPVYDFFDTMIKNNHSFPIIAEDLGIITPDVRDVMHHYGFPGMKILQFAFSENNPQNPYLPHNYETNSFVYTGTHDNNTTRGWLEHELSEKDIKRLYTYIGRKLPATETVWELIRLAMISVAAVAVFPMQDLLHLGSQARVNTPSKHDGNWKWQLHTDCNYENIEEKLKQMTSTYGRAPDKKK